MSTGDAFLTIKSAKKELSRSEFEYPIPEADARNLIALAETSVLEKERFTVLEDGELWTVDVFGPPHAGLVIAELELASPEQQCIQPHWAGQDVTGDKRFYNEALARAVV